MKFVILRLISEKPMHGYEVMQALKEESCGCYEPSPGSVYPTLQMLEDEGYVRSQEDDGKKVYEITEEGMEYLEEHGDVAIVEMYGATEGLFAQQLDEKPYVVPNYDTFFFEVETRRRVKELPDLAL